MGRCPTQMRRRRRRLLSSRGRDYPLGVSTPHHGNPISRSSLGAASQIGLELAAAAKPVLHGRARLAVLFGSTARDRARPDSDVDLAFLPLGDMELRDELAL